MRVSVVEQGTGLPAVLSECVGLAAQEGLRGV